MNKGDIAVKKTEETMPERVEKSADLPTVVPPTDVYRREGEFVVVSDMPGVSQSSLEVELDKNVLTIVGTAAAAPVEGHQLIYQGYQPARYERSFTLPADVDRDKIVATVKHGVLQVILPKSEAAQPKKIPVQVAS
jgi:HSP20 family protein